MEKNIQNGRILLSEGSLKQGFIDHLNMSLGVDEFSMVERDKFMALAYTVRDRIIDKWIKTQQKHYNEDAKRVYYLSLEFLIGRSLGNNVINLNLEDSITSMLSELGYNYEDIREEEVDAGLGNGGLGRLAACFIDSMATLNIPSFGYGLRYDYGIFRQEIKNGYQKEQPDEWLRNGYPWEIKRDNISVEVKFGGHIEQYHENGKITTIWNEDEKIIGIPYDTPVVGYGGKTINTLRLWSSKAVQEFDFMEFNEGDYVEAVKKKVTAENITKVLYPNDTRYLGKELRLKQQYFFVACSIADIIRRFKKSNKSWSEFPKMCAIQLNDTHPSLAIPELMRILLDQEKLEWDDAWSIVQNSCGYTNHTLMPEALETWPVSMLEKLLPRHLQIIYEINHKFLESISILYPQNNEKLKRMSIVQEGYEKHIRMAYLSIIGSHSTNGVAELHTKLLKERLMPDFAEVFPQKFNNKTNGITQRRWILKANPGLSDLITESIGDKWITNMDEIKKLKDFSNDSAFVEKFIKVKKENKEKLSNYLKKEFNWNIDPNSIYDVQVKRIHEYKRQLLNALHIVILYNRLKTNKNMDFTPRTFFIGGKAAPGYKMAKDIIKLINNISHVINNDNSVNDKLKVFFLPNYRVSLAEKIFPASEISEQISTAGTEASGTGNMKFMANGALTIGTMDGANIEIAEEVGLENIFIFGLSAKEVKDLLNHYNPEEYFENEEIKDAVNLIASGYFNFGEPNIFDNITNSILSPYDQYVHLADLTSYAEKQQMLTDLYKDSKKWNKKAILNVASCGKFSSDRTILEYAKDIWNINPLSK